ncbi:MAG: bifunctional ligase/repressor BirA [marine bacterium B5-7]|nr:MAG: bifunctional ligase/repressor BirA [marine bacterium B5-7]
MTVSRVILDRLAEGRFVSGQKLADELNISRAAIQQHVATLKHRGLDIQSVHGRGYRLARPIEPLSESVIRQQFNEGSVKRIKVLDVLDQVDSTNQYLRSELDSGRNIDACFAEYQLAGRGRRGRTWLAAPYGSILFSLRYELSGGPAASSGLSLAAGVAAARALEKAGVDGVELKWPNDLMLGGDKLGGVLIELSGELGEQCTCIIGVGLNLYLPERLAKACGQKVTSLDQHNEGTLQRNNLAALLVNSLVDILAEFDVGGFTPFRDEWQRRDLYRNCEVCISHGEKTLKGVARGVADDGALLVESDGSRIHRITTGEVMA